MVIPWGIEHFLAECWGFVEGQFFLLPESAWWYLGCVNDMSMSS